MSRFRFGRRSVRCLKGVHPDLVVLARRALDVSEVDFGLHCGRRTVAQQRVLVNTGKSLTMNSRHLTGHAIDVHPWIDGAIPWHDPDPWGVVHSAFFAAEGYVGVPFEWGGHWARLVDMPHFQLPRSTYP